MAARIAAAFLALALLVSGAVAQQSVAGVGADGNLDQCQVMALRSGVSVCLASTAQILADRLSEAVPACHLAARSEPSWPVYGCKLVRASYPSPLLSSFLRRRLDIELVGWILQYIQSALSVHRMLLSYCLPRS